MEETNTEIVYIQSCYLISTKKAQTRVRTSANQCVLFVAHGSSGGFIHELSGRTVQALHIFQKRARQKTLRARLVTILNVVRQQNELQNREKGCKIWGSQSP